MELTYYCRMVLPALYILSLFNVCSSVSVPKLTCDVSKKSFIDSGLGTHNLYSSISQDQKLAICSQENTCCKVAAEQDIHRQSLNSFKSLSDPLRETLKNAFSNTSEEFVEFLTHLINNSYSGLDLMFQTTYQERYEKNKHVFQDLFSMLQLYVRGDDIDLKQLCENFFALLYQKVYILFNPMYTYSKTYESCILDTTDEVKPFGDGPRKVTLQISRSFLATRVFIEGLKTGRSVVNELLKLESSKECSYAFTKMLRCSGCSNFNGIKPCYKYCLNVMKGCNAYMSVVNKQWTDYVSAMLRLAHKLEGPFSVESIIEPLGVKISEAIMVFQDHKDNITSLVWKSCNTPPPVTAKMFGDGSKDSASHSRKARADFPFEFLGTGAGAKPTTAAGTNLDRLVTKAKASLEPLKGFWERMAYNVCASGIATDPASNDICWNGKDSAGYKRAVVKDGIPDMFQNPEVRLNISDPKIIVRAQVLKLKVMTQRILTALHGTDSKEIDTEEDGCSGSGSGEGSGMEGSGGSGCGGTSVTTPRPVITTEKVTTEIDNGVETDEINGGVTTDGLPTKITTMGNEIPDNNGRDDVSENGFPQANANTNGRGASSHLISNHVSILLLLLVPLFTLAL